MSDGRDPAEYPLPESTEAPAPTLSEYQQAVMACVDAVETAILGRPAAAVTHALMAVAAQAGRQAGLRESDQVDMLRQLYRSIK